MAVKTQGGYAIVGPELGKDTLKFVSREACPGLYEGNQREKLLNLVDEKLNALHAEKGTTRKSLAHCRELRRELAEIQADADQAGLYVGQPAPVGKAQRDKKALETASFDLFNRAVSAASNSAALFRAKKRAL